MFGDILDLTNHALEVMSVKKCDQLNFVALYQAPKIIVRFCTIY